MKTTRTAGGGKGKRNTPVLGLSECRWRTREGDVEEEGERRRRRRLRGDREGERRGKPLRPRLGERRGVLLRPRDGRECLGLSWDEGEELSIVSGERKEGARG